MTALFLLFSIQLANSLVYSQTPFLRTPLGPEKVSVLRGALIKRVNFGKRKEWDQENCP